MTADELLAPRIPPRALPVFGRSSFRGSIAPDSSTPTGREKITVTEDPVMLTPPRITAVRSTEFSYPNRRRLGSVGIPLEWWRWRTRMRGEIFRAAVGDRTQIPRRMAAPRRLSRLVPSRKVTYDSPMYDRAHSAGDDLYDPALARDWRDTLPLRAAKTSIRRLAAPRRFD